MQRGARPPSWLRLRQRGASGGGDDDLRVERGALREQGLEAEARLMATAPSGCRPTPWEVTGFALPASGVAGGAPGSRAAPAQAARRKDKVEQTARSVGFMRASRADQAN